MSRPVTRREVLIATSLTVAGCSERLSDEDSEEQEFVNVTQTAPVSDPNRLEGRDRVRITVSESELEDAGTITGQADPLGFSGDYQAEVYWTPSSGISLQRWTAAASIGTSRREPGRTGRIYLNEDLNLLTSYLLAHEFSHCLGFEHDDESIMSYGKEDVFSPGISETTRTIAEHTDGLGLLSWDDPDSVQLEALSLWAEESITTDDLEWVVNEVESAYNPNRTSMYSDGSLVEVVDTEDRDVHKSGGAIYREGNSIVLGEWA